MKKIFFSLLLIFISSVCFAQWKGDSLGDHKAKRDINMDGNKIDGVAISEIPITTTTLQAQATRQQAEIDALAHGQLDLYLTNNISNSDQYYLALTSPTTEVRSSFVKTITGSDILIASWTTNEPVDLTIMKEGTHHFHIHGFVSSVVKETRVYLNTYRSTGAAATFLFATELSNVFTTADTEFDIKIDTNDINVPTSYLSFALYASAVGGGGNPDLTVYMEGNTGTKIELPAIQSDTGVTKVNAGTNISVSQPRGDITVSLVDNPSVVNMDIQEAIRGKWLGLTSTFTFTSGSISGTLTFTGSNPMTFREGAASAAVLWPRYGFDDMVLLINSEVGNIFVIGDIDSAGSPFAMDPQPHPTVVTHSSGSLGTGQWKSESVHEDEFKVRFGTDVVLATEGKWDGPVISTKNVATGDKTYPTGAIVKVSTSNAQIVKTETIHLLEDGNLGKSVTKVVGFTSNCDYVCDGSSDNVQINLALNAITSSGTVMLREGIYNIADDVIAPFPGSVLKGMGKGTVLELTEAGDVGITMLFPYCSLMDLTVVATTDLDQMINANGPYFVMQNCDFISPTNMDGDVYIPAHFAKIYFNNFSGDNGDGDAIVSVWGGSVTFAGNTIYSKDIYGVTLTQDNSIITGNTFLGAKGIWVSGENNLIEGNTFRGLSNPTEQGIHDTGANNQKRTNVGADGTMIPEDDFTFANDIKMSSSTAIVTVTYSIERPTNTPFNYVLIKPDTTMTIMKCEMINSTNTAGSPTIDVTLQQLDERGGNPNDISFNVHSVAEGVFTTTDTFITAYNLINKTNILSLKFTNPVGFQDDDNVFNMVLTLTEN